MKKILAILFAALLIMAPSASANVLQSGAQATPLPNLNDSESIQPYVAFQPDRCIVVKKVTFFNVDYGYKIEAMGGQIWNLELSKKVGINGNVKAGQSIELMVGPNNQVYGWKIL